MPHRLRLAVLIAVWCGLRQGEIVELRRADIDVTKGVIKVRRAVARVPGEPPIVGGPKSGAGVRDVSIPPHLMPEVERHLRTRTAGQGLAAVHRPRTPASSWPPAPLYRHFYPARDAAGRPDRPVARPPPHRGRSRCSRGRHAGRTDEPTRTLDRRGRHEISARSTGPRRGDCAAPFSNGGQFEVNDETLIEAAYRAIDRMQLRRVLVAEYRCGTSRGCLLLHVWHTPVAHACGTPVWHTPVWHTPVAHACGTRLCHTSVSHACVMSQDIGDSSGSGHR